jgi:hypothetical protein
MAGTPPGVRTLGGHALPTARTPARGDAVFAKEQAPTLKVFGTELGTKWYDATSFVTPHDYFLRSPYPTPRVTRKRGASG